MTRPSWLIEGTSLFTDQADSLSATDFRQPSRLPGWTRGHVITHVARNADALRNLLSWARTGIETPMYASPDQRADEIATGAARSRDVILRDLAAALQHFHDAMTSFPEQAWSAAVQTARGRTIAAAEIPWLRTREVWVHAVDLDAGASFDQLPPSLADALITDAVDGLSQRDGCPRVLLTATDRVRSWSMGAAALGEWRVQGTASTLLGWLIGREMGGQLSVTPTGTAPPLPAWL